RPDALKRVAEGPARSGTPRWGTPRSKEIFRTTTGRGDAPGQPVRTILFLHGAGQDADTQVVKHLIAGLDHAGVPSRIVSLPWQAAPATVDAFFADLPAGQKVVIAGHSAGGGVALDLAVRNPGQISAAVVVNPAGGPLARV